MFFKKKNVTKCNDVMIKRLRNSAKIPTRGSLYAAGYDIYADLEDPITIMPHNTVLIPTGLAMAFPENTFGAIYSRSGLATKRGLRPANCTAVIDADYRGEIFIPLHNDTNEPAIVEPGERIAQLILQEYIQINFHETMDELPTTQRGHGGFGSTGTK